MTILLAVFIFLAWRIWSFTDGMYIKAEFASGAGAVAGSLLFIALMDELGMAGPVFSVTEILCALAYVLMFVGMSFLSPER